MHSKDIAVFVLMRFNVEFPGFEDLDNNDPDWLDYRLRLAELTSFHSLKQQSHFNFRLVVLINSATPASFIDALITATRGLNAILLKAESAFPDNLASTLLDHVDSDCIAIQTSRIDSDDMYHPDYLRNIDAYCIRNDLFPELTSSPRYFRYPHGQDYLTQSATYNRILYPENAFGTLIEPLSDSIQTVFCDKHKRISKRFVSYSLDDGKPMWCRILHGSNLLNKPRKPLPLNGHFPVHPDLAEFARQPTVHPPQKVRPAPRLPKEQK
jgi:Putative rhamnosyl transferase